jgi:hypothetical protein
MAAFCAFETFERLSRIDVKLPFAMTAVPLLLERLQLTGALVTIDAIGTQTDIAERIAPAAATICSR